MCLLREEGSFPVRSFVLHEGVRFPLGVASAGTAIMAFLPRRSRRSCWRTGLRTRGGFAAAHTEPLVRDNLAATRQAGYSVNPGLVLEGQLGDGRSSLRPAGPACLGAVADGHRAALQGERQATLGRLLMDEAHRISTLLQGADVGPSGRGYFHQVSKMVTGTVRLWRVRRYFCSISSAAASGTSRPSR